LTHSSRAAQIPDTLQFHTENETPDKDSKPPAPHPKETMASCDPQEPNFVDEEETLTPLEQEVLDEYARLLENLNTVRFIHSFLFFPFAFFNHLPFASDVSS
jgi:outer membrane protein OmpA-like peptidoglycan-associated protein